jgi:hypothetical protein
MKLVAGIPTPVEYHLDLTLTPAVPRAGQKTTLKYVIHDPWKDLPVKAFQPVHERFFHTFVVSQDLEFFTHGHPWLSAETGTFLYDLEFPKPGMYRVLGDFYPDGATPQMITKTVVVPGKAPAPVELKRDYSAKSSENMKVSLTTEPLFPIAGQRTALYFRIEPGDGLEKYLAAWGHALVASDDLIDITHLHPFYADGGPQILFTMSFQRARTYRIWVQFQRNGVVNTVHFDVPVKSL